MKLGHGATKFPESWEEFGAALKTLRGSRSLRLLAAAQEDTERFDVRQVRSKTYLHRLEKGEARVSIELAEHIDLLYDGRGWLSLAARSLWRSVWDPWSSENAALATVHAMGWPAPMSGAVWIKIHTAAQTFDAHHTIDLEWGPWMRRVETPVSAAGVVLLTGKMRDADGISRTCNLTCDKRVFALFGAGSELTGESHVIDIRRGWRLAT